MFSNKANFPATESRDTLNTWCNLHYLYNPINRTIYRLKVGQHTRSTTWIDTVRNWFHQKGGEIEVFRELEIGEAKWCKEHILHKGNDLNDITEEGISLLNDTELWWEKQDFLWACHISRQKDRMNIDGSFRLYQRGTISATFTSAWYQVRESRQVWRHPDVSRRQDSGHLTNLTKLREV